MSAATLRLNGLTIRCSSSTTGTASDLVVSSFTASPTTINANSTENKIVSVLENGTWVSLSVVNNLSETTNTANSNSLVEPNKSLELQIVVSSSTINTVIADYYISIDTNVASDDTYLGSQSLEFNENNLSITKTIRFTISNKLIEVPFFIGACFTSFVEKVEQLNCTEGIMIKLDSENPANATVYNSANDNIFINWLDEIEILFI